MAKRGVHLLTWVDDETKRRFATAAHAQDLSESALLKRLVTQMLAASGACEATACEHKAPRDARLTVRLRPVDQLLLKDRAAARGMPAATYISTLLRGHLNALTPLPAAELQALRTLTNAVAAVGRNVNQLVRIAYREDSPVVPRREELMHFFNVCRVIQEQTQQLLKANADSWNTDVSHERG